jgi:hypothetical protein
MGTLLEIYVASLPQGMRQDCTRCSNPAVHLAAPHSQREGTLHAASRAQVVSDGKRGANAAITACNAQALGGGHSSPVLWNGLCKVAATSY